MRLQSESHWARRLDARLPHRRTDVVCQTLDDEAILHDPRTGRTHHMNQTALWVWHACDGQSTTEQVAERMTQDYDVPFDVAMNDVEQLVAALAQADLVTDEP